MSSRAARSVLAARATVLALWTIAAVSGRASVVLSAAGTVTELLSLVDGDLSARNVTACDANVCRDRTKETWRPRYNTYSHGCFCDAACAKFGDCCRDAVGADTTPLNVTCTLVDDDWVFLVSQCPAEWPHDATRRRCEAESDLEADPLAGLPVTNPRSGLTYRNAACAQCHAGTRDAVLWQAWVECPTVRPGQASNATAASLRQNRAGEWGVTLTGGGEEAFRACDVHLQLPPKLWDLVRPCVPAVSDCPADWDDLRTASLCGAYTARVHGIGRRSVNAVVEDHVYRNPHCALCSGVAADNLDCDLRLFRRPENRQPPSFSILFDIGGWSGGDAAGLETACPGTSIWDPFFRKCRDVFCDADRFLEGDACVPETTRIDWESTFPSNTSGGSDSDASDFRQCPKYVLFADEFEKREDGSVYVGIYDRHYGPGEFEIRDGTAAVCSEMQGFRKFGDAISIMSMVFVAASITCLCCHLVAFCLVSDLRNLPGKNLASLSVCLLVGYMCCMVAPSREVRSGGCRALAVIMYTACIASFFWMNVMAFDVFITLRRSAAEFRVTSGGRLRRFLLYTLYVCAMTGALVTAAVATDHYGDAADPYRPEFGDRVCWFSRKRAMMVFFAAPLIAVMVANVALFFGSARIIRKTAKASANTTSLKMNLRLYSRLAVITGLSWVVGLVAGWIDFPPLWYAFVVLNTLQGVFIFLSFTLADRVRSRIARQLSRPSSGQTSERKASGAGTGSACSLQASNTHV